MKPSSKEVSLLKRQEKKTEGKAGDAARVGAVPNVQTDRVPGEWKVVPDSTCSGAWLTICVDGDIEREICRSNTFAVNSTRKAVTYAEAPEFWTELSDADEIREQADIMAASRELLESAEAVCGGPRNVDGGRVILERDIEQLEAAIAKARGTNL